MYVKFSPTDFDQLAILDELDIELFDYPLDHEISRMGDYYIAEGRTAEDIPEYYTVVPPNFIAPTGVAYEVLEQLYLPDYDTYITQEAFRMTGNDYTGEPYGAWNPRGFAKYGTYLFRGRPKLPCLPV